MGKFFREHRKPLVLAAVLLIVLTVAIAYKLYPLRGERPTTESSAGDDTAAVSVDKPAQLVRTGSVENPTLLAIYSEFSGLVSEIYVTEGQAIQAGQPLFKLEPAPDSGETSAKAPTKQKPAAPLAANYESAVKEYNRLQKLYEQGAIPRRQLENAAANLKSMQDGSNSDSSAVASSRLTEPVTVNASIGGVVKGLAMTKGNAVQGGQQVLALGAGQAVEVVVALEQNDLYLVQLGTAVTIEVANQAIAGKVVSIYPEVQENKIASFRAHVKLANPADELLKAGMTVKVLIDTSN